MKHKNHSDNIKIRISLDPMDYPAIICVLPLLSYAAVTPVEIQSSSILVSVLGQKLARFETTFQSNEILAMSRAIDLAISAVSGKRNDLLKDVKDDPDWHSSLQRHYLALSQMSPLFHRIIAETGIASG